MKYIQREASYMIIDHINAIIPTYEQKLEQKKNNEEDKHDKIKNMFLRFLNESTLTAEDTLLEEKIKEKGSCIENMIEYAIKLKLS